MDWLAAWGLCGLLIRPSTVWLLPFALLSHLALSLICRTLTQGLRLGLQKHGEQPCSDAELYGRDILQTR